MPEHHALRIAAQGWRHAAMLGCALAALAGPALAAQAPQAAAQPGWVPEGREAKDPMFDFDGVWQGRLRAYNGARLKDARGIVMDCRLVIDGVKAEVFRYGRGAWKPVKPGLFAMARWASQAVVTAITSGHDSDGLWVESITFVLVHETPGSVLVYATRAVNNLDLPSSSDDANFAFASSGRFTFSSTASPDAPDEDSP